MENRIGAQKTPAKAEPSMLTSKSFQAQIMLEWLPRTNLKTESGSYGSIYTMNLNVGPSPPC